MLPSDAADGHLPDLEAGGLNRTAEQGIVADHLDAAQNLRKGGGNGEFMDGVGDFSLFDPESLRSLGKISVMDHGPKSSKTRDQDTVINGGDQLFQIVGTGLQVKIPCAARVARRHPGQLFGGIGVQKVTL